MRPTIRKSAFKSAFEGLKSSHQGLNGAVSRFRLDAVAGLLLDYEIAAGRRTCIYNPLSLPRRCADAIDARCVARREH